MKELISIVVPVYNVQDYVLCCLDSLREQYYKNIEIIIVDDGSTDDSGKICDNFAKKEKRAKVFHKKNGGLSDARNFGIKKSNGGLIAFVDSDDHVEANYISRMKEALDKDKSDIVVCGYDKQKPKNEVVDGFEATVKCLIRQHNVDVVTWNKLYKKELFIKNNILFPVGQNHEDILTTYKLTSKAKRVSYLDDALYHYRERDDSITNSETIKDKLIMREKAANEAIMYFSDNKELEDVAEVSLMLAKYAYIDSALDGKIDKFFYEENKEWLKRNISGFVNNKFVTKKLKIYNFLNGILDGKLYRLFRKIV